MAEGRERNTPRDSPVENSHRALRTVLASHSFWREYSLHLNDVLSCLYCQRAFTRALSRQPIRQRVSGKSWTRYAQWRSRRQTGILPRSCEGQLAVQWKGKGFVPERSARPRDRNQRGAAGLCVNRLQCCSPSVQCS